MASALPGFDFLTELDEIAFRNSGLGFSACGHDADPRELAGNFPALLAVKPESHLHAE